VKVYGEAAIAKFAKKCAASRKPRQRFLEIARAARWPHLLAVKRASLAEEQVLFIQSVMTHEEYDRENF
jgi:hypothetical protein